MKSVRPSLLNRPEGMECCLRCKLVMHVRSAAQALLVRLIPALDGIGQRIGGMRLQKDDRVRTLAGTRGRFRMIVLAGEYDRAAVFQGQAATGTRLIHLMASERILARSGDCTPRVPSNADR